MYHWSSCLLSTIGGTLGSLGTVGTGSGGAWCCGIGMSTCGWGAGIGMSTTGVGSGADLAGATGLAGVGLGVG